MTQKADYESAYMDAIAERDALIVERNKAIIERDAALKKLRAAGRQTPFHHARKSQQRRLLKERDALKKERDFLLGCCQFAADQR